jgi:hypothetical protein
MEVHYRWHPWFGLKVTVNRSYTRRGVGTVCATLEQEGRHQVLEVPSWMFDLAMCAAMPLVDHPYVDIKHLQALKELLKHAAEEATADVIETQHLSSSRKGDADEEKKKSPPLSTQSVSVTDNHPTVGVSAPRSETASMASACATVARGSQRSPRRSSEGGGR